MSFQVDTALVNSYRSNIEIQFQQKGSRLRPYVRQESQNAEFDFYDRIGPTDVIENTGRHQDTPFVGTDHSRRRVGLRDFDWADLVDKKDKLRMLADPTSPYTQNAVMAFGRKMDAILIEAAEATAYTGKTGTTAVVYDTNFDVAVNYVESGTAANSNLTIGKLRRARFLFDSNESVEEGEKQLAIVTASQVQALLRTTEITSSDYNTIKALVAGEIDEFMGFKFIRTELVRKSGNVRYCLFVAAGGLLLATAQEVVVDVGPRRDKRNSTQIYVCASFGASRMWEQKIVRVACDETA
jgi:hypothetical protein